MNEAQEDSLDEQYLTHSSRCDSDQPPSSSAFLSDVQEASSAVEVTSEYSHCKENKTTNIGRMENEAPVASTCLLPLSRLHEIISAGRP